MSEHAETPPKEEIERATQLLTTEHSTLQTGRSATVFEANGRISLYLGSLSGAIVALAFVGRAEGVETTFLVLGITLLLPLLVVGIVTFTRVVQTGILDLDYARRIERIRGFYTETSSVAAEYMDPPYNLSRPAAIRRVETRDFGGQMLLTAASMVAVVNSAVAGAVVVMLCSLRGQLSLGIGAAIGTAVFLAGCAVQYWYQLSEWRRL